MKKSDPNSYDNDPGAASTVAETLSPPPEMSIELQHRHHYRRNSRDEHERLPPRKSAVASNPHIIIQTNLPSTESDLDLDRPYDLTPVGQHDATDGTDAAVHTDGGVTPSYTIDPWEAARRRRDVKEEDDGEDETRDGLDEEYLQDDLDTPRDSEVYTTDAAGHTIVGTGNVIVRPSPSSNHGGGGARSTFLFGRDIHPNMESKEDEIAQLRLLAGKLSADWRAPDFMAPALARRIRDFQFAQEKRRKKYGDERPWGILGLYDHLSAIRTDVEWAEDAAIRRSNGQPYLSWAEFDESKKGGRNRPFFTYVLLAVCTVLMVASIGVNDWTVEPLDENPMIGPSASTLIRLGAKDSVLIVQQDEGWRLLTATVLHAGLVHYFINMLALWFVGAAIETSHGWPAAMVIFLISAVGGTILSAICLPEYITVGASGGIFGFIGACLADIIMNWKLLFCDFVTENGKKHRHAIVVVVLLLDILLNSIIGLTPYVDNFTHLGGMAYGFLCGLSTIERLSSDFFGMEEGWFTQLKHFLVRFCGLITSMVCIITTLIILLHGDGETTPCPNCTWLSCVPFPPWGSPTSQWWYCDDCDRVTAEIVTAPFLHLEVDCPGGSIANVTISAQNFDRDALERNLPSYCRQYCLLTENKRDL